MNENELVEKWNDELFLTKTQFATGKRILETIEREFGFDAGVLEDDEWNELVFGVVSASEGMVNNAGYWTCRVFAEMAADWAVADFYGIDPTAIERWAKK